jgi:hypothetical protein
MLTEQPWTDGNGTIEDVRRIVREFYDEANREQPEYFPANEPAEKTYDTGRLKWQRDIQGGRVTFESEPNAITADFDREEYEVYDYEKRLPKRFMSEKSSTSVYIGAPEEFAEWIGYSVDELLNGAADETDEEGDRSPETRDAAEENNSGGFLSRLFGD